MELCPRGFTCELCTTDRPREAKHQIKQLKYWAKIVWRGIYTLATIYDKSETSDTSSPTSRAKPRPRELQGETTWPPFVPFSKLTGSTPLPPSAELHHPWRRPSARTRWATQCHRQMPSATKPGAHTRAEKRKGQKRTKMMVFYYMGRFLKKKRSTKKWCGVENCAKKESAPKSFAASQERNTMLGHHLSFDVLLDHTIVPSLKSSMAAPLLFCAHSQIWGKPTQNAPTTIHDSRSPPSPESRNLAKEQPRE